MANLTYAQLEGVWLQAAAGTQYATQTWAALMAAIAEAESGGDPSSTNPTDNHGSQTSWGLWQISNGDHSQPAPNWNNPLVNAQLALGKLQSQGLGAWGTYSSGAYKAYISGSTTPDPSALSDASLTSSVAGAAAAQAAGAASDCAWQLSTGAAGAFLSGVLSTVGLGGGGGSICLVSRSQIRGLAGVGLIIGGTLIGFSGLATVLVAAGLPTATRIAPAVAPVRLARGLISRPASKPAPAPARTAADTRMAETQRRLEIDRERNSPIGPQNRYYRLRGQTA